MSRPKDFWSKRREGVKAEEAAEQRARLQESEAKLEAERAEQSDEEILAELGLPDPDSLGQGDDFTAFMSRAVPDRLRRRALRRLWLSNPALANVDGLLEYGEDYTDAATVIENMQTLYEVGKGMPKALADIPEPEDMAEAEDAAASDAAENDETESDGAEPEEQGAEEEFAEAEAEDAPALPRPRRMQFRIQQ